MDSSFFLVEFDDLCLKNEVKIYEKAFRNIATSKEVQKKIKMIVKDKNKMREFEIILAIIRLNFEDEIRTKKKAIAFHLISIIRNCLKDPTFWEKLCLIIACQKNRAIKIELDDVIASVYEVGSLVSFLVF